MAPVGAFSAAGAFPGYVAASGQALAVSTRNIGTEGRPQTTALASSGANGPVGGGADMVSQEQEKREVLSKGVLPYLLEPTGGLPQCIDCHAL